MLVTVLLLQILSNFADEYGDLQKGVDNKDRVGPHRGMQRGEISFSQMRHALIGGVILTFLVGSALILVAFGTDLVLILVFFAMGLVALGGAIAYTVGKHAYGYYGLGDLSCLLFFGLFAVVGGFFLYARSLDWTVFLAGFGVGFLITGVLNLNNMRDIENDAAGGKITLVVRMGSRRAVAYHYFLVIAGMVGLVGFAILAGVTNPLRYLFVLPYALLIKQLLGVGKVKEPADYDRFMKPLSLTIVLICLFFALCLGAFA
jgi:1,4-dihydroxy-2-naphthoate octaprenyltransferase